MRGLLTKETLGKDLLASVVVFLVALPLCMGIAIASGVPPSAGLITGIIGGIVVGALAGAPLQVSGPAAGLTVLVWQIVNQHGLELLGAVVLVAGIAQLLAGLAGLGQLFRAISPAVIHGMLAGIGVLIVASQFHIMVDDKPRGSGIANVLSIPEALWKAFRVQEGTTHHIAAGIGLLTIAILMAWTTWKPVRLRMVPGALVAVVISSIAAALLGLRMNYVDVPANLLESVTLPVADTMLKAVSNRDLLFTALALAFIASAETLLCASAVDQMHTGPRANYNRELVAQGTGNLICGALGVLPMTGVIVRSSANAEAGAQTRASAIFHGVWLLALVLAAPGVLRTIPTASLAAILVYTGFKLVNPAKIRMLARFGRAEVLIYLATLAGIVTIDLLSGVMIGFGLALVKLLYTVSNLKVDVVRHNNRVDIHLEGAATFIGLPKLAKALEDLPLESEKHIHFHNLHYVDHACFDLISNFKTQQEKLGSKVFVELSQLEDRFWRSREESPKPASGALAMRSRDSA